MHIRIVICNDRNAVGVVCLLFDPVKGFEHGLVVKAEARQYSLAPRALGERGIRGQDNKLFAVFNLYADLSVGVSRQTDEFYRIVAEKIV